MPDACCKPDYDAAFDARTARRQAMAYRREGATGTTRRLIDAIKEAGVEGSTALDVGGGVGVIGLELLAAGAASSTEVEASRPYIAVAEHEARRRGFGERTTFRHGDFVEIAGEIPAADVVTLDRVICCYRDWPAMVDRSVERARRLVGLVYPNDRWWTRIAMHIGNLTLRMMRQSFRGYIHPERAIDARIRGVGFEPRLHHRGWVWQTVVYERGLVTSRQGGA
jgi:hypothetical protein